jgi:hypothetical protein
VTRATIGWVGILLCLISLPALALDQFIKGTWVAAQTCQQVQACQRGQGFCDVFWVLNASGVRTSAGVCSFEDSYRISEYSWEVTLKCDDEMSRLNGKQMTLMKTNAQSLMLFSNRDEQASYWDRCALDRKKSQ